MKSKKSKTIKINCKGSAMMKLADLEVIRQSGNKMVKVENGKEGRKITGEENQ